MEASPPVRGFVWDARFETGLAEIDSQHRVLVGLVNHLAEAAGTAEGERNLTAGIEELTRYAAYHFGCEENLMREWDIDEAHASGHVAQHRQFARFVTEATASLKAGTLESSQVVDFGVRWLTAHILGSDQRLAAQLLARQAGARPEAVAPEPADVDQAANEVMVESMGQLYGVLAERNTALAASETALKRANASLEARVVERTAELRQVAAFLEKANEQLRQNFMSAVRVLSNTIELAGREENRHARRVAELARDVALGLSLPPTVVQTVTVGGLLHDLGRIGLDPRVLEKPWPALKPDERRALERHPLRAHTALVGSPGFDEAALAIRHLHERWDGTGFPDELMGTDIPVAARVLAAAVDFEHLRLGHLTGRAMSGPAASEYLRERAGRSYDPAVVAQMMKVLAETQGLYPEIVREAALEDLEPGMVLGRDVLTDTGVPILACDQALSLTHIRRLRDLATRAEDPPGVFVRLGGPEALEVVIASLAAMAPLPAVAKGRAAKGAPKVPAATRP